MLKYDNNGEFLTLIEALSEWNTKYIHNIPSPRNKIRLTLLSDKFNEWDKQSTETKKKKPEATDT